MEITFAINYAKYLVEVELSGYGLYDFGSYPGIRIKPGDRVRFMQ